MNFQKYINDLEISSEILEPDNISTYISAFIENNDKIFLLDKIKEVKNNIPYLRNIYTIIIWISDEYKDIDLSDVQKYLHFELINNNLKEWTKIIFTNLLIKISNSNYLKEIIDIYNKQINDNSISIWSIENFTDFFCKYEKWVKFVDCFLYFRKDWIRFWFNDWIKWLNNRQQWILNLTKDKYIYFLQELWNKKSLKEYVWHLKDDNFENSFTQKIIDKWFNLRLKKELYDFLISLIKYWNEWKNNYYREKVYYKQIQNFFNRYREEYNEKNFFIKFFDDISYDKKWFYYFRFFEEFISNVVKNENDVSLLLEVDSIKSNDYILAYRIYQNLKELSNITLIEKFEEIIWEKINNIKLRQEEWKRKNDEYLKKDDNKKYEEIKSFLEMINRDNKKWFLPILFKYYLENEDLLFSFEADWYNINKIINEQLNYFLTWENLNPWNIDALKWFEKTEWWYNWFTWYFDESLELALKISEKLWKDLSSYKNRLSYYIPFQLWDETLNKLFDLCWFEEFENIYKVYKEYSYVADFHPQNIITYYEKVRNELSEELKKEVLEFLKSWIEKYKSFYDKEKVLDFLYEFWEKNKYFQGIFNWNKGNINYFNYWSRVNDEYQSFRLALKANEILIKNGDKESIEWRLEQIKWWKTENREYWNWFLPDDDINLSDDDFINVLKQIKSDNSIVIDLFIDLLKHWFDNYEENYTNYCFYIFKSFNYYLTWLSNISKNPYLVNKIWEILSKIEKTDAIIYFKRYIDEFENWLFLEKINTTYEKNKNSSEYFESIISKQSKEIDLLRGINEKHNKEKVVILTEWPTDYYHLKKAFEELYKNWFIKTNFLTYFKKLENIWDTKIQWSCIQTYSYIEKYSFLHPNKLVIWIFDTDDLSFLNEKDRDIFWLSLFIEKNINSEKNNLFIFWLWYWDKIKHLDEKIYNNKSCIELMYDEDFLEGKILTKKFKDENYNIEKFVKSLYKFKWNYFSIKNNEKKEKLVYDDKKMFDIYDSKWIIYNKIKEWDDIKSSIVFPFLTKIEFAKNIEEWKYDNELTIDVWKRFLPIFNKIEELINDYNKNNINILKDELVYISKPISLLNKILFSIKKYLKNISN